MAFFKFRKRTDESASVPAVAESVEALRRRARHRLIGAAVLVLIGVVGFPLLFDRQPRPIAVDLPIDIPDKGKVKPLTVPPAAATPPAAAAAVQASAAAPQLPASVAPEPAVSTPQAPSKPVPVASVAPAAPAASAASAPKTVASQIAAEPAPQAAAGQTPAAEGRYVVQVGAFAEAARVREARQKLERAGFKTYTQAVEAKDGPRVRVRVGPFAEKADAEKAAARIKKLDLPAVLLTL